jgi:hypothetical protein
LEQFPLLVNTTPKFQATSLCRRLCYLGPAQRPVKSRNLILAPLQFGAQRVVFT